MGNVGAVVSLRIKWTLPRILLKAMKTKTKKGKKKL